MEESMAYDGWLPWMPNNADEAIREGWRQGLQYEHIFFDDDMDLAPSSPEDLNPLVRKIRTECIILAMEKREMTPLELELLAAKIDRRLLTASSSDDEVHSIKCQILNGQDIEVEEFKGYDVQTPSRWFTRMAGVTADWLSPELKNMFVHLALDGGLAHITPSVVAGAMFVHLLGIAEAEQYLCGYELYDVAAALNKLQAVL